MSEFAAREVRKLLDALDIKTLFVEPDGPWALPRSYEFLGREPVDTPWEAKLQRHAWVRQCNTAPPNGAFGYRPPHLRPGFPRRVEELASVA